MPNIGHLSQFFIKRDCMYSRNHLTPLYPPLSPQINWKMLLGGLFPQQPEPHDVLIVHNPNYLRKLGRIIALFGKR